MYPKPLTSIREKIIDRTNIAPKVKAWKEDGKRVIFTNGCFDIIHSGHIFLLSEAKSRGDMLVVGLNTDRSVSRLKGPGRPVNNENDRAIQLAALLMVDAVVLFEEDTPLELIKQVLPALLVKGGDYEPAEVAGKEVVEANGGQVEIIPLKQGYSTSSLIERLREN